jgi:tight adherence protein C
MKPWKLIESRLLDWNRRRRQNAEIAAALPEAIDLLVIVMQAGLDFQVALLQYLQRAPQGVLRDELAVVQAEISLGTSRADALRHLKRRVSEPGLQETIRTILQGLDLGASLTPILRLQAQALRQKRAFEAEKRAAVVPLKLMFPLFVFIFPTVFIALLGPVVLAILKGNGG